MKSDVSLPRKILFTTCIFLAFSALAWGLTIVYRARSLYSYATEQSRGWLKPVHEGDALLGWRPIAGVRSAHTFKFGPPIPMGFDEEGFRTPLGKERRCSRRPIVLALGCSFTYGDACAAEDTFPYKVAEALGGTELNAGVCSYGLAQMLILAERLIPEHRPDYVLVQYSPWLVDRATEHFAPTYFSYSPSPYFANATDGELKLKPPVFLQHDVDLSRWREHRKGVWDFMSFLVREALPLYLHDDLCIFFYGVRMMSGSVDSPTTNRTEVVRTVYDRIISLCLEHGADPIIVVLGSDPGSVDIPGQLPQKYVVNAQEALLGLLPEQSRDSYSKAYAHYRGTPPVMVDKHPNPHAHSVIAESIVEHLRNLHYSSDSEKNSALQGKAAEAANREAD